MMEIKIAIDAPALAQAINHLADVISGIQPVRSAAPTAPAPQVPGSVVSEVPAPPAPQAENPETKAEQLPSQTAPVESTEAPATSAPSQAGPTAKPVHTKEQLSFAGTALMEKGLQPQLEGILEKYGVKCIPQLKPEQYDAVANDLIALGAEL